jgi:hypothetical protein
MDIDIDSHISKEEYIYYPHIINLNMNGIISVDTLKVSVDPSSRKKCRHLHCYNNGALKFF